MDEYINREYAVDAVLDVYCDTPDIDLSCEKFEAAILKIQAADVAPVRHGRWEDGRCSNCKEEAVSTSFDEPIYDYDWEENLQYSHTETHTEYHLTNYCPNCGAIMDLEGLTDGVGVY